MRPENSLQNLFRENGGVADDFRDLCDVQKHPDPNSPETLRAVYRFSLKFACRYLDADGTPEDIAGFKQWFDGKEIRDSHPKLRDRVERMEKLAPLKKDDGAAIAALLDLPLTASIVREIAFAERKQAPRERFVGADLGAGSAITTAATGIAAVRSGASTAEIHGFELQQATITEAVRTLTHLPTNVGNTHLHWELHEADLTTDAPYRRLLEAIGDERKDLQALVSETFNNATPHPVVAKSGVTWLGKQQAAVRARTKHFDPFMHVTEKLHEHMPWVFEQIRAGETILFPDFINDKVAFKMLESRFRLLGVTESVCISNIGEPFSAFEDPELHTRFPNPNFVKKEAANFHEKREQMLSELEACVKLLERRLAMLKRQGVVLSVEDLADARAQARKREDVEETEPHGPLTPAERRKRNRELERKLKKKR